MNGLAYCRYSSSNQNYVSIESQLRIIRDFAAKKQIQIIREYLDPEKSASIFADKERPEFQRMISEIQAGIVAPDYLLFYSVDRFSRNEWDFASLKKLCREKCVRILYAAQDIPEGAFGGVIEGVYQNFAIYYSIQLSEHIRRQKDEVATQALHRGGPWPVGYVVTADRKYQIDPKTTGKARLIFSMYAAGKTLDEIAAATDIEKYTVRGMLRNPLYVGDYVARVNSKTEKVILRDAVPATIEREVWEVVQKRIEAGKKPRSKPKKGNSPWLLTGKAVCGECGATISGNSSRGGRSKDRVYNFYTCTGKRSGCKNKNIQKELFEDYVLDHLREFFKSVDIEKNIDDFIKYKEAQQKEGREEIERARADLKTINGKMKNLLDGIAAGTLQHQIAGPALTDLDGQKKVLEARLSQLDKSKYIPLDRETIRQFILAKIETVNEAATPEAKRMLIDDNIDKVILYADEIEILFKFKAPAGMGKGGEMVYDERGDLKVSARYHRPT